MNDQKKTDFLAELKVLPIWVAYSLVWNEKKGKADKPPINPKTGSGAKSNDATTWATYQEAVSMATENARKQGLRLGQNHGVGFEFSGAAGYAGIDLDNVILEDGSLKPFAREIVNRMDSYTEYSPSGNGLHIIFKLQRPMREGARHRNDDLGVEMYDTGRYFTVTEKPFEEPKPIAERTEAAREVYAKYLHKPESKKNTPQPAKSLNIDDMTDHELWEKMFNSRNGRDIQALYNGDISGYADDWSRADLALCNYLAFWCQHDELRMDNMFRQSGLMRSKWDEQHGAQTYGAMTIDEAIRGTPQTYTPPMRETPNSKSKASNTKSDNQQKNNNAKTETAESSALEVKYIEQYLADSLESDIGRFQKYATRKTGYSNIDEKMSLYPGLYVLGAVSSLGKTTFALQMADQLARAGEHVLFFILEQTRLELVSKGLSRLTAQENFTTAISSIEIRAGRITDSVRRAIAEYKNFARREAIIECSFDTTIEEITATIQEYIKKTGVKPVCFVDYLQLIRPLDPRQITKDAVDNHVRALKKLQMKNDLVIFLISSLNRQNYLTTIDFESFKESGGIEYTADVIMGLQLYVMNADLFDSDKKLKEKREIVRAAKREVPRHIELCILKNRYGIATGSYFFNYYAQYDLFIPVEVTESPLDEFSGNITTKNTSKRKRI